MSPYPTLLNQLKKYCSINERCRRDVILKIQRLKAGVFIDKLIEELEKDNFINENRYLQLFSQSKIRNRKWGYLKVKAKLLSKGIAYRKIEEYFEKPEKEVYRENLHTLLTKKLETLKKAGKDNLFARLMRFGLNRGYEQELVMETLNVLLNDITP